MIARIINKRTRARLISRCVTYTKKEKANKYSSKEERVKRLKKYYECFFKKAFFSGRVHSKTSIISFGTDIFDLPRDQAINILAVVEGNLPSLVKHTLRERAKSARITVIKERPYSIIGGVNHD